MYNIMDASFPLAGVIGSVLLIVICSFFLTNIILAVLAESISDDYMEDECSQHNRELITKSIFRSLTQKKNKLDNDFAESKTAW